MKKLLLAVAGAMALGTFFVGCDLNPTGTKSENAKVNLTVPDTLSLSTTTPIIGKIKADEEITEVSYAILNSNNEIATGVTVSGPSISKVESYEFKNQALTISVGANVSAGTYKLQIIVVAGPEAITNFSFYVKGTTGPTEDPLQEKEVTVGNQDATKGSALDVDEMVVYGSSEANGSATIQAKVDAWFGIVSGKATMMAPASANGFAPVTKNWTSKATTKFLKVSEDFDDITYQSDIDELWSGSGESLVSISTGDVFVIETDGGDYRLLKIESASSATDGTVTIKGKIK